MRLIATIISLFVMSFGSILLADMGPPPYSPLEKSDLKNYPEANPIEGSMPLSFKDAYRRIIGHLNRWSEGEFTNGSDLTILLEYSEYEGKRFYYFYGMHISESEISRPSHEREFRQVWLFLNGRMVSDFRTPADREAIPVEEDEGFPDFSIARKNVISHLSSIHASDAKPQHIALVSEMHEGERRFFFVFDFDDLPEKENEVDPILYVTEGGDVSRRLPFDSEWSKN